MLIQIIVAGLMLSVPPSSKCPFADDSVKRSFHDDLDPIVMDIDGDGKPDTITPRLVVTHYPDKKSKLHQSEWIVFDLKTSRGRIARSFFKYHYGTEKVDRTVSRLDGWIERDQKKFIEKSRRRKWQTQGNESASNHCIGRKSDRIRVDEPGRSLARQPVGARKTGDETSW